MAAFQACQVIGMPECRINLAHIVSYLAEAPKSTRAYEGLKRAEEAVKLDPTLPVPLAMRNAPTKLMKDIGYGASYHYNPEFAYVLRILIHWTRILNDILATLCITSIYLRC
jgi:putative ATPase